jgi:hypothetical protein
MKGLKNQSNSFRNASKLQKKKKTGKHKIVKGEKRLVHGPSGRGPMEKPKTQFKP